MEKDVTEYQFGTIEDILRGCEAEPTEPDRQMEMDGGVLLTSGVHVYLPRHEINVHEGFFCHMENGQLEPLYFLTVIYDRTDKEFLYDAEENFVDTVHQWLKGKCTPEQFKTAGAYDPETGTIHYEGGQGGGPICYRVTGWEQEGETLSIDYEEYDFYTGAPFEDSFYRLTVKNLEDGSFCYLSNLPRER